MLRYQHPLFFRCIVTKRKKNIEIGLGMTKVGIPILVLFSMFLVALPNNLPLMPGQISPLRPVCASQFALVNYACSMVPLVPLPPGTPPPVGLEDTNGHRHGHRHRHSHRPRNGHHETPQQNYCCRWLKLVDAECVCDKIGRAHV